MKIEFEVDEERIKAEAINRMIQMLWPAIEAEVKNSVRQIVQAELGTRTRITRIIEDTAYQEALRIFQEEFRQHAEAFRQKLVEHILVAVSKG